MYRGLWGRTWEFPRASLSPASFMRLSACEPSYCLHANLVGLSAILWYFDGDLSPFINSSAWRPYNTIAKLKSTSNKHKDSQLTNKGPRCLGVSTVNLNVMFKIYAKELPINLMMKQCLIFKESCLSINNLIITLIFLRLILETNYRSNHVNELKSKSIHRPFNRYAFKGLVL